MNEHFRMTHPPVQCNMCEKTFDTPAAMVKHRYLHYEYMYECDNCGKGFHFESQLREHLRVHQVQGNWTCFCPKCGKRFKCESELNEHLIAYNKKEYKCDECAYSNTDPRNLRAHLCRHSNKKPFLCIQNVVKDSSGCSKGNDTWRQTTAQRAMRKAKTVIYSIVTFLILLF